MGWREFSRGAELGPGATGRGGVGAKCLHGHHWLPLLVPWHVLAGEVWPLAARMEECVVCEGPINRDVLGRGGRTPTTQAGKAITAMGHGSEEQRGAIQIAPLCLATCISGTDLFWILILYLILISGYRVQRLPWNTQWAPWWLMVVGSDPRGQFWPWKESPGLKSP